MQLLGCRANLQATKHAFMLLSRAFTSWHLLLQQHKRLEVASDTLQVCTSEKGTARCTASYSGVCFWDLHHAASCWGVGCFSSCKGRVELVPAVPEAS